MMDAGSAYMEYGAVGIVCALFSYMVMNIIKSLKSQDEDLDELRQSMAQMATELSNVQSIILKLLDRINAKDKSEASRSERTNEMRSKSLERFGNRVEYLEKELIKLAGKLEGRWSIRSKDL